MFLNRGPRVKGFLLLPIVIVPYQCLTCQVSLADIVNVSFLAPLLSDIKSLGYNENLLRLNKFFASPFCIFHILHGPIFSIAILPL